MRGVGPAGEKTRVASEDRAGRGHCGAVGPWAIDFRRWRVCGARLMGETEVVSVHGVGQEQACAALNELCNDCIENEVCGSCAARVVACEALSEQTSQPRLNLNLHTLPPLDCAKASPWRASAGAVLQAGTDALNAWR
eukprot:1139558-Rhodomonas_salina.1